MDDRSAAAVAREKSFGDDVDPGDFRLDVSVEQAFRPDGNGFGAPLATGNQEEKDNAFHGDREGHEGEAKHGEMPSTELLTAMGKYNEELVKAGIMLAGDGLHPSSKGARVRFSGPKRTVIDGPFAETKELIAGFWIWQVRSLDEAIEWVKRCPNPMNEDSEIEIRQIFEAEDFGEAFTPELQEQEERMRAEVEKRAKS